MMIVLLAMGLLLQQEVPKKYAEAASGIELPKDLDSWKEKSPYHRKAIEVIADRAMWAKGLQLIDEKLGLFAAAPKISVIVAETDEAQPAKGGGRGGVGEIHVNLRKVAEYLRKVEEMERRRAERKGAEFAVPPTPLATLIHHELTHCFTGVLEPLWLTEGMAVYAAGETAHLWAFQHRKAEVAALDAAMPERDAYALGYCALAWVERKFGGGKVKDFVKRVLGEGTAVRQALEQSTGMKWEDAVAEERGWAREFLGGNYTPPE